MFGSSLRLIREAGGDKVLYYSLESEEVGTTPPKHKSRNPNPLSQHPCFSLLLQAVNVAPRQQSGTPKHTHTQTIPSNSPAVRGLRIRLSTLFVRGGEPEKIDGHVWTGRSQSHCAYTILIN